MSGRPFIATGLAAILALLVACSTTPPEPSPSAGPVVPTAAPSASETPSTVAATFDPALTPPPVPFEGLYVGSDVSVSGDATVTVVRSAMSCPALEHLIGAGEWAVVGREAQQTGSGATSTSMVILTLQRGDDTALAWIAGGESCTARIARTTSAPLRVSGAATFDGATAFDQPFCLAIGGKLALLVTYRAPGGPNLQVTVVAPARMGSSRIDPEDVTVSVARGTTSLARMSGMVMSGLLDAEKSTFPEAYAPTEDSKVSIDVQSLDPFSGTLQIGGYEGARGTIDVESAVECHLTGGALRRAVELAAAPPPTASPGAPGPTLEPFEGAGPGTVVATGGKVAGTYAVPASELDCYFDHDEGAWTINTVSTADPTFYAYVFVGQGGGSADQVATGLIIGDGSNDRVALLDTRVTPPDGTAHAQVTDAGGQVTLVLQARLANGVTFAANLSCAGG